MFPVAPRMLSEAAMVLDSPSLTSAARTLELTKKSPSPRLGEPPLVPLPEHIA